MQVYYFMVLMIILHYRYYNTEGFSSISIIMMLNIMIHDNIVYCPALHKALLNSIH